MLSFTQVIIGCQLHTGGGGDFFKSRICNGVRACVSVHTLCFLEGMILVMKFFMTSCGPHTGLIQMAGDQGLYPHVAVEEWVPRSAQRLSKESAMCVCLSQICFLHWELSKIRLNWVLGLAFLDFHGTFILCFQITEQDHVSPWSATRCARDSSAGSSAQKLSAVPQSAEPGATPVRCALPSLTPAAVASFPTSARELVKVNPG